MSTAAQDLSELSVTGRRISAAVLENVHLRLDLFALELGEERRRVAQVVLTTLGLALAIFMVFLCANALVLIAFWETHRIPIAIGMCAFYGILAAILALVIALRARRGASAFAATRAVLERDRSALRGFE